jgi:2'-5' RNA ligase
MTVTDGGTVRLFTALWPEPRLRVQLARCRDAWVWPPAARPVAEGNLHATLHFIGGFPRERLAALRSALDGVAIEPTALHLAGTGMWRGGIAVARIAADDRLLALHARLGVALARLGVGLDERPFLPHVTLARRAQGALPPAVLPELAWPVSGFALVESVPGTRPAYAVVATWPGAGESGAGFT